jgi:hypothetical protein
MKSGYGASRLFGLLATCATVAACGDDSSGGSPDGGAQDTGVDVADVGGDAGEDTSVTDTGADTGADGVADAGADTTADVERDAVADAADAAGDADGSDEPLPDGCQVTAIEPATFVVGDAVELTVELFCPDAAVDAMKPSFAVLLGGSSSTRCGAQSEEDGTGGTWFRAGLCFDDLTITRDLIGRLELQVIGAPGAAPIVSSVGVAESIDALAAAGGAPTPGIDLRRARLRAFATGAFDDTGAQIAITTDSTHTVSLFVAGADGTFSGDPVSRALVGRWDFDDAAGQDTSGLVAPVGGFAAGSPFANAELRGCSVVDATLACGSIPIVGGVLGSAADYVGPADFAVDRVLDVQTVAAADAALGDFGTLDVLAVASSARGIPAIWRFGMGSRSPVVERISLPTDLETSIVSGEGYALFAPMVNTVAEGPDRAGAYEIWTCTPDTSTGGTILTAGTWEEGTSTFTKRLTAPSCGGWRPGSVTAVRAPDGKIAHILADSFPRGHTLRLFPSGSRGADVITLTTPAVLEPLLTPADFAMGPNTFDVRQADDGSGEIIVTASVALPDGDSVLVGFAEFSYNLGSDLTGVSSVEPDMRSFSFSMRVPLTDVAPTLPLLETWLPGGHGARVALPVGDGTTHVETDDTRWECEDTCLESVSGPVLCGNTGHFLTVQVGGTSTAVTLEAIADDGTRTTLGVPAGMKLSGVPGMCFVGDGGEIWLAGMTTSTVATETDGLQFWPITLGGARPTRTPVWIGLGGPLRGARLYGPAVGTVDGTATFVGFDASTSNYVVQTISATALTEAVDASGESALFDEIVVGEPTLRASRVAPQLGKPFCSPGFEGRAEPAANGLPTWFWQTATEGPESCEVITEGASALFSDASVFEVSERAASCDAAASIAVAGNFGLGVGPIRVSAATSEQGPTISTVRFGSVGWAEQVLVLTRPVSPTLSPVMPRIVAADFNGDELTDLFVDVPGANKPSALFADGNGGWLNAELADIPALRDLQSVFGGAPGIAARSIYGREGYRVQAMRRATRSSPEE